MRHLAWIVLAVGIVFLIAGIVVALVGTMEMAWYLLVPSIFINTMGIMLLRSKRNRHDEE